MLLEFWQDWSHDHSPGKPGPGTDHRLSEEPFPNVQSELCLMQLHSISLFPVTSHQRATRLVRERPASHLHLPFHCPPWGSCRLQWGHLLSLLKAEQTKWSPPLLVSLALQAFHLLGHPPVDTNSSKSFLYWRIQNCTQYFRWGHTSAV